MVSQNGKEPATNKKDGKNMAARAISPPNQPFMTVPRYEEKVNKGPGTAWAAP
ncbi:hypothetical protein D3C81_1480110 [compost metagenome]